MGQALVDLQNAMAALVLERDAAVHAMDDLKAKLDAALAKLAALPPVEATAADLQAVTAQAVDVNTSLQTAVLKDDPPVV